MCCWNSSWIADGVLERFCRLGGSRLWRTYLTTDMQHLYVCDCPAFILCFVSLSDTLFSFWVSVDLLLWDKLSEEKKCTHTHFVFVMFLVHFLCFFNLLFLHYLIQHPYRVYLECTVTARKSNICLFDPSLQTTRLYCTFILPQPCILTHHVVRFPPPPANHKIFQKSSKFLFLFSFLCHLYCLGGGKKLFWVRSLWKQ